MHDFVINIATCKRADMLEKLLEQIEDQRGKYKIEVNVYEDKTSYDYDFEVEEYVNWYQTNYNFGKKRYWELVHKMMDNLKSKKSKYYLFIPDDFYLKNNFFKTMHNIWESIEDKILVIPYMPDSRHCTSWNNFYPVKTEKFGKYELTDFGYVDMNFMCDQTLLEQLDYSIDEIPLSRWDNDETLSSGVGRQMTYRLNGKMWLYLEGAQYQVEHPSVMNPQADCSFPYL